MPTKSKSDKCLRKRPGLPHRDQRTDVGLLTPNLDPTKLALAQQTAIRQQRLARNTRSRILHSQATSTNLKRIGLNREIAHGLTPYLYNTYRNDTKLQPIVNQAALHL